MPYRLLSLSLYLTELFVFSLPNLFLPMIADQLINDVCASRQRYLQQIAQLSQVQAEWKPSADVWNVIEITEHLFWAEQGGILSMWKAVLAHQQGKTVWEGEDVHQGLAIEVVVERTWQPKEIVPAVAAPRLGGPIGYWASMLQSLDTPLQALGHQLSDESLAIMTPPHPISGPLNLQQRLEFLRFHIDRHYQQVEQLLQQLPLFE
ncbi:MAG: DinB family protein [Spirosomataceae bacterium]